MVRDVAVHQPDNSNSMRMAGYTHDFLDLPESEAMEAHGEAVRGNPSPIRVGKMLSNGHLMANSISSNCHQNQHHNMRSSLSSLNVDDDEFTEIVDSNSVSAPTASNQLGTMHDARRESGLGL